MFKPASEINAQTQPIADIYAAKHLTILSERIVEAIDNRSSRGQFQLDIALTNMGKNGNIQLIEVQPDTIVIFAVPSDMQSYLTSTTEKLLTELGYKVRINREWATTNITHHMSISWK